MNENMKKIVNVATPAVCVVALVLSVAAISNTNAATAPTPVVASSREGTPFCGVYQISTEFKDSDR